MKREIVNVPGRSPSPILNAGCKIGNIVWTAGNTGSGPDGKTPDDFDAEVRNTLDKIKATLEAAGASLDSVLKVNIYLSDINLRPRFNQIYLEYFPKNQPARTCIGNAGFDGNTRVEVECVAAIES